MVLLAAAAPIAPTTLLGSSSSTVPEIPTILATSAFKMPSQRNSMFKAGIQGVWTLKAAPADDLAVLSALQGLSKDLAGGM